MCGVVGSNPKQQSNETVKLMIDSGSQRTVCGLNFAKDNETDDSEGTKLWGIQDQKIEAHGKKLSMLHGQAHEAPIPASIKVDVSDVARNVVSLESLLRAGFDVHFTNLGHTCWMENGGQKTTTNELHEFGCGETAVGARVALLATARSEQLEERSRVALAGLVRGMARFCFVSMCQKTQATMLHLEKKKSHVMVRLSLRKDVKTS